MNIVVAAFVWREHVLYRRRTPEERYRRDVLDVRRVQADLERSSHRLRSRQWDPGEPVGLEGQQEGSNMTAALVFVGGLAIVAGLVGLMMWADRVNRRRVQRRRDA
jgi:hypothetical protein